MAVHNIKYASSSALTITMASLATSATHISGRESTEIDNTSNVYVDALLEGFVTVGTTPTIDTTIRIYVWGSHTALSTTAKDALDGADSAETLNSEGIRNLLLKRAATLQVDETVSNQTYYFGPLSIAELFGEMPQYWGVFVAHDTGVNLNSTGSNHEIKYTGIEFETV